MKLHEAIQFDITAFDAMMEQALVTDPDLPENSVIRDSVLTLIRSGGKRLRPMLVMIGGRFGTPERSECKVRLERTAILLEYMHMASLVHDDIIDDAETRRGSPALHRSTDVKTAIHTANYMMARALEWASEAGGIGTAEASGLASLAAQLCLGEYGQLHNRFNFDFTLEQYLEKTRNKTAMLMSACLKAGAEAADAPEAVAESLRAFGDALGMAFQIEDDLLDFVATSEQLGKPAGADLRQGNITLPVLYAMELPELRDEIRSLHEGSSEEQFRSVVERIAASEAMARSMELHNTYIAEAQRIIQSLSNYPAAEDLLIMLHFFTKRRS